ncbi:hypothetical protein C8R42DRAFT_360226 [Lentinula raphanica]|nr:hypothetical protein C8R42DRAFT_360226 [Lentinula raphanica]
MMSDDEASQPVHVPKPVFTTDSSSSSSAFLSPPIIHSLSSLLIYDSFSRLSRPHMGTVVFSFAAAVTMQIHDEDDDGEAVSCSDGSNYIERRHGMRNLDELKGEQTLPLRLRLTSTSPSASCSS